jgi:hypothetical protein
MASLSTVIQGLLVAQLPEYEISNDAIGYLCNFSEKLLVRLINESQHHTKVSAAEVKVAICSIFPSEWAEYILNSATAQLRPPFVGEREAMLMKQEMQEINDFELIDGNLSPERERKPAKNLFISADFIKGFIKELVTVNSLSSPNIADDAGIYLSVSIECALSKFIQQAQTTLLKATVDQMVITQHALLEAINVDPQLTMLAKALNLYSAPEDVHAQVSDFEPIEDDTPEDSIYSNVKEPQEDVEVVHQEESTVLVSQPVVEEIADATESFVGKDKTESDIEEYKVPVVLGSDTESHDSPATTIPQVDSPTVAVSELNKQPQSVELHLPAGSPSQVAMVRNPIVDLYGRCCPYFEVSSFAIHMLSSILEIFIRHVISETYRIGHPHARIMRQHAREAVRKLTTFQSQMLEEISHSEGNLFNGCINASVKIMPSTTDCDLDVGSYIAEVVLYISSRILLVASAHARLAGLWLIHSNHIVDASLQFISAPIIAPLIQQLNQNATEGPVVPIPAAPRIRAAEMIYLSSIIKETPLQLDNQLLVIFVFLVTLSIHTLCVR